MPRRSELRLTKRTVETKDTVFRDRDLAGFGVRVHATGRKVYVVQVRGPAGPKRVTVGRHGVLGAEQARRRAALIIARVKAGEAPTPEPPAAGEAGRPTVEELARRYLEEHVAVRYKPSAVASARTVVYRHIVSAFGKLPLAAVERVQVMELHHRRCETPFVANMMVATLSLMCRLAEGCGMAPEGCNPCQCIVKYPERKRERG